MASRTPFFDLPPRGIALCVLLILGIAGVAILPDLAASLAQNKTAAQGGETLLAPCPGREDEVFLFYTPEPGRMTVVVVPDPADTSLTLAVARQANPTEGPIPLYGPVTFDEISGLPSVQYTYGIEEPHILTVTTLGTASGESSRYRVSFGGPLVRGTVLEVETA